MSSSSSTILVVVIAICLASVQASAIGRKGIENKDTVEVKNNGITIKSGYEGYLHNEPSKTSIAEIRKDDWFPQSKLDVYKAFLMYSAGFLPAVGLKIAKVMLHFVVALFVGMGATVAVCSVTPICNISFNANKTSLLPDKMEMLPALKEALEVVSRIPKVFNQEKTPTTVQPEKPSEENVLEEIPEQQQELDARSPRKDLDTQARSD